MALTPNYRNVDYSSMPKILKSLPQRIYFDPIKKDLQKKMVFIGGPRQVGKTTLSQSFLKKNFDGNPAYLNWDSELSRKIINKGEWPKDEPLLIFDEIHKRKGWQQLIKGIWDTWRNSIQIIVTGSARLDIFRKSGDSMMGRYHYYRIHPYTLPELGYKKNHLQLLFQFGGFPEPLLSQDDIELRRWHLQRVSKLVRIDLRDLENISDLDKVELLAESLLIRVGSPLSYRSLAEDLEVSDKTVKRWVQILDSLYYCFLIPPFGSHKIKAIKKSQKLYLWDWSQIENPGAKFENMVASHLLKWCDYNQDVLGYRMELRYIRDDRGAEVDFVVLKNKIPVFAVECKLSDVSPSNSLIQFKSKINIPMWYQVHLGTENRTISPNFKVLNFESLCRELNLI